MKSQTPRKERWPCSPPRNRSRRFSKTNRTTARTTRFCWNWSLPGWLREGLRTPMQDGRSATKRWDTASKHGGTEPLYQKAEILRELPESGYRYWQRDGGSLVNLLCSRNARPRKDGKGAAGPSFLLAERARSECARPMRAVKDSPATPLGERVRGVTEKAARGPRWTRAIKSRPGHSPLRRDKKRS
jgi:hypothetical protein